MRVVISMKRVILIKYGELSTKKGNRNFFINTLNNNIKNKLKNYDVRVHKEHDRMTISFEDSELNNIKSAIDKVFGIHSYHIAYVCDSTDEAIRSTLIDALEREEFKSFKIEVRRAYKGFPIHSQDYNKMLGGLVLKYYDGTGVYVDVHKPDLWATIEIKEDETYIYFNSYAGSGGYPVGSQPRGLLMLSGGIDSPVAGYLAMKRGIVVDAVYFEAIPHTSLEAREKVISLCRKLARYTDHINLHIVNFTPIQEEIYRNCCDDYVITIMRRMMYRLMEMISKKYKALAIINGESIGQVASQTLTSMSVINGVTNMPVIRPVACLDKLEIIDIARKIDTYETSILPYEDCCTVFVPRHPVINPRLDECELEESKFDYSVLLDQAVDSINTIKVYEESSEFSDLL